MKETAKKSGKKGKEMKSADGGFWLGMVFIVIAFVVSLNPSMFFAAGFAYVVGIGFVLGSKQGRTIKVVCSTLPLIIWFSLYQLDIIQYG